MTEKSWQDIMPDDRVIVFDNRLYVNDIVTPLSVTLQPATVIRRYGYKGPFGTYPDVVDVRFDHDGRESRACFTEFVKPMVTQ